MNKYSTLLLRFAALFGAVGAFLGAHMAGSGSYAFRPIHAHILVVGWLSLFAWAVYYKVFQQKVSKLAIMHVWTAIIGSFGLTIGMAMFVFKPAFWPEAVNTIFYIVGGAILLLSFFVFFIQTLFYKPEQAG